MSNQRFVEIVKSDHAKVEKFLKETENEHGSLSSIKKAISGISLSSLFNVSGIVVISILNCGQA